MVRGSGGWPVIRFIDRTSQIDRPASTKRRAKPIDLIIVHRIRLQLEDYNEPLNAWQAVRMYREHDELAKAFGRSPYTFWIFSETDKHLWARVEQVVPLAYRTPHARTYNDQSVGIGVYGDFRHQDGTPGIIRATEMLCARLLAIYPCAKVVRHDELKDPPASSDPNKVCPGFGLPVHEIAKMAHGMAVDGREPPDWSLR